MTALFDGYPRADGAVGTRNHLLVLSVTGLTGPAARRIGRQVMGALTVTVPYGSGLLGADRAIQERVLRGLAAHPNVGAILVIGGDRARVEAIAAAAEQAGRPAEALVLDRCGHDSLVLTERGVRGAAHLARRLSLQRREPAGLEALFLGLECGRSDPSSGLVANPLLGRIADRVVESGGRAVIGETTEWLGAEAVLTDRAASPDVAEAIRAAAARREALAAAAGIDLTYNNPSETNIEAGLSSIEEKSLGAVAKSGASPVQSLIGYGEAPAGPGLHVMDAPAYAPESLTGFTAAGANLLLFTTGVGNSFVSALNPTIKVSANPETCARLTCQLDFDASDVFRGLEPMDAGGERLLRVVLQIASGALTFGEVLLEGEEVISRFGEAL